MGEVFEEEDSVIIIKEEGSRSGKSKNIKNHLEEEIRIVIQNMRSSKREPVPLPVGGTQAFSFSFLNFSNKMEIYT